MEATYSLHVRNTSRHYHTVNFCLILSDGDEDLNETKRTYPMVFDFKPLISRYAEIRPGESHTFVWKNEILLGWAEYGMPWSGNGKDGFHVWRKSYFDPDASNQLLFNPDDEFQAFKPIPGTGGPQDKLLIVPEKDRKPNRCGICMGLGDLPTTPVWVTPGQTFSYAKKPRIWMVDACGSQTPERWLGNVHMVDLIRLDFPSGSLEKTVGV